MNACIYVYMYTCIACIYTFVRLIHVPVYDHSYSAIFKLDNKALNTSGPYHNNYLLFLLGPPSFRVTMSPDFDVVPNGYSIELTCTANSTSLPAAYRQNITYVWGRYENDHIDPFKVRSDGAVALEDGSSVERYTLTNNNRTLRIASVSFFDNRYFFCGATESGSNVQYWNSLYLNTVGTFYMQIAMLHIILFLCLNSEFL